MKYGYLFSLFLVVVVICDGIGITKGQIKTVGAAPSLNPNAQGQFQNDENDAINGLQQDFELFDANKDGLLSQSEVIQMLSHKFNEDVTVEDGQQKLSPKFYKDSMANHFSTFDKNKDGLSVQELQKVISKQKRDDQLNEEML